MGGDGDTANHRAPLVPAFPLALVMTCLRNLHGAWHVMRYTEPAESPHATRAGMCRAGESVRVVIEWAGGCQFERPVSLPTPRKNRFSVEPLRVVSHPQVICWTGCFEV